MRTLLLWIRQEESTGANGIRPASSWCFKKRVVVCPTDTYDNLIRRWLRAQDRLIGSKTPWSERFKFYRLSRDLQPWDLQRYHLHRFRQPSTVEPLAPEPTVEPPQVSRDLQALHMGSPWQPLQLCVDRAHCRSWRRTLGRSCPYKGANDLRASL